MRSVSYIGSGRVEVAEGSAGAPATGEVQLAVAFTGLCGTDMHIIHGSMDGRVTTPLVFGHEMSGIVEGIGETGTLSVPDPNLFEGSELDAVLREGMLTVTLPPHSFATVELNLEPELTAIEREEVTS